MTVCKILWSVAVAVCAFFAPLQWLTGHPIVALVDAVFFVITLEVRLNL